MNSPDYAVTPRRSQLMPLSSTLPKHADPVPIDDDVRVVWDCVRSAAHKAADAMDVVSAEVVTSERLASLLRGLMPEPGAEHNCQGVIDRVTAGRGQGKSIGLLRSGLEAELIESIDEFERYDSYFGFLRVRSPGVGAVAAQVALTLTTLSV